MKNILHDIAEGFFSFLSGLVPGAFGAGVSLAYEEGLTWSRRITQMMVGITVSYFARNLAASLTGWDGYVLQAVGFVVGMTAFKATPALIAGIVERAPMLLNLIDVITGRKGAK
ncbi:hypothetical protein QE363_000738 [Sphingomonas sp. SORGH_AS870]|uniref:hypothetical protein n=1 Tax=Sphingomonas sp. SORGH_AS_0870 TaxID=3041801 RepID=UPI002856D571|nr:hypothetical protein [Sphingomonas sp. SORGH_AS_0870]MDR6144945.1 hypothetical protein [Sphingomonas sp. SORGH_AS_0870]